jgi:hypothetical protein
MSDQNGHVNHGWKIPAKRKVVEITKLSPEGKELRKCPAGCGKWIPYGPSFHYEECPNQP